MDLHGLFAGARVRDEELLVGDRVGRRAGRHHRGLLRRAATRTTGLRALRWRSWLFGRRLGLWLRWLWILSCQLGLFSLLFSLLIGLALVSLLQHDAHHVDSFVGFVGQAGLDLRQRGHSGGRLLWLLLLGRVLLGRLRLRWLFLGRLWFGWFLFRRLWFGWLLLRRLRLRWLLFGWLWFGRFLLRRLRLRWLLFRRLRCLRRWSRWFWLLFRRGGRLLLFLFRRRRW